MVFVTAAPLTRVPNTPMRVTWSLTFLYPCLCRLVLSKLCFCILKLRIRPGVFRVTRVTRMAYSPSLWLMAIGW